MRAQGLYLTEKCDGCGKLLNQTFRYTIAGRREVYCSPICRDNAFFGDRHEVMKRATPGKCVYCGGSLKGKKRGALYCDDVCHMRHSRVRERTGTRQVERSRTPTQSNQAVGDAKTVEQGKGISGGPHPFKNARAEVAAKIGLPVEVGQATLGSRGS
jgi:hypothetical protein